LSESSVTFPFREVVVVCTEVDQVETAEHRPFAQSAADVEAADVDWLLLLLPPHPAASVARATTATTQTLPPPALAVLGIERTLPLFSPGASSARDDAGVTPTTEFHAPRVMASRDVHGNASGMASAPRETRSPSHDRASVSEEPPGDGHKTAPSAAKPMPEPDVEERRAREAARLTPVGRSSDSQ
jgi:hypothetical protein